MYNLTFKTFAEACKLNNATEAQMVEELRRHLENKNYRSNYNTKKNLFLKVAKQDPQIQARMEELKRASKAK